MLLLVKKGNSHCVEKANDLNSFVKFWQIRAILSQHVETRLCQYVETRFCQHVETRFPLIPRTESRSITAKITSIYYQHPFAPEAISVEVLPERRRRLLPHNL